MTHYDPRDEEVKIAMKRAELQARENRKMAFTVVYFFLAIVLLNVALRMFS